MEDIKSLVKKLEGDFEAFVTANNVLSNRTPEDAQKLGNLTGSVREDIRKIKLITQSN